MSSSKKKSKQSRFAVKKEVISSDGNIEKTTNIWKLVKMACSFIAIGFGAGFYIGKTYTEIQKQDTITEYREQIIELNKIHEKEIHDFNAEFSELTEKNIELKYQLEELKIKYELKTKNK